jgi:hypothetical protein
MTITATIAMMM